VTDVRAVGTIVAKDLRQRSRDRSLFIIALVVPAALAWVFSLVFGDLTGSELEEASFAVANVDRDAAGDAFIDQFLPVVTNLLAGQGTDISIQLLASEDDARQAVDSGEVDAAWVIPAGFTASLSDGGSDVMVITSADRRRAGGLATALGEQFALQARGQVAALAMASRLGTSPAETAELADALGSVQGRIRLDTTTTDGAELSISAYLAGGMAVFFLFFTVQFGVLGYLEERRDGTLARLLASPIRAIDVIAAKVVVSLIVGIVSVSALLLLAVPLMGAAWGSPLVVGLLVVAAVIAATTTVGAVSAVARTAEQANVYQTILAVVLGMLGGSFFTLDAAPAWLRNLSGLTPHGSFLDGLRVSARGGGVADVIGPLLTMLVFGAVVLGITALLVRREAAR
jgi:ABC-2 type transport system permease protein